jgi:hypothetical protein
VVREVTPGWSVENVKVAHQIGADNSAWPPLIRTSQFGVILNWPLLGEAPRKGFRRSGLISSNAVWPFGPTHSRRWSGLVRTIARFDREALRRTSTKDRFEFEKVVTDLLDRATTETLDLRGA